jgi:Xaa-Pro aminopeptidase
MRATRVFVNRYVKTDMTHIRVPLLRASIAALGLDGFILPRADEHLGEYVPPRAERLAWLTGFTGSAGLAVVLTEQAAVFTDGRYVLQLAAQTDPAVFQTLHIIEQPPPAWLAARARRIGYDPWLFSEEAIARYEEAGLEMVAVSPNPIDALWTDQPPPPSHPAEPHPLAVAGRNAAEKCAAAAAVLQADGQEACVISDPASVNWLLNIRGGDIPFTPIALGYAVLHANARVDLYMDPAKLGPAVRDWLGDGVACHAPAAFAAGLAALAGQRVRVDRAGAPAAIAQALRAAGATVAAGGDPCLLPKACKNPSEQQATRDAHSRDAVAVCRFLHWLGDAQGQTEMSAAARLLALRQEVAGFRGESFPAISGAGEHGAIIHYRVTEESDRAIRPDEVYLIDSGAQYPDGTTDVTRTVWTGPGAPSASLRERFTRVLQGNIALATTVFPQGVGGLHLDAIARRPLWAAGLDYDHGTGHGVGLFLSVHEGPVSLSRVARPVPIGAGMILSDEPGYYAPGEYGIRLENLLMAQPAELPGAARPFLRFEVLTLAPFDRRLIDPALLDPAERDWLDAYHARVAATVGPALNPAARDWLMQACRPLAAD